METFITLTGLKPAKGLRLPMPLLRQVVSSLMNLKFDQVHPMTKPRELANVLSLSTGKAPILAQRQPATERFMSVLGAWNAEQGLQLRAKHGLGLHFIGVSGLAPLDTIEQCFEAMAHCSTAQIRRTWVLVAWNERRTGAKAWSKKLYLLSGEQILMLDQAADALSA